MNSHIEKYLDLYLDRKDTEYAILISGKWGSGKTHFINNYIENKKIEKKYKFIYVSLFGLKNISAVNDAIFQELHPILSHKATKLFGELIKSAVKFGINIDLNGDGKNDSTISISPDKFKFFNNEEFDEVIFVFDDLERTIIDLSEILGFINSLCEKQKLKVLIIANEDEVGGEDKLYSRFKEKVIGKTFTISKDNNSYWNEFEKKYGELFNKENIINIRKSFDFVGDSNYRNLNQTIDDYTDFIFTIEDEYRKNSEFKSLLIEQFFRLSLEYRKENNIKKVFENIKEKDSSLYYQLIFDSSVWSTIISGFYIDHKTLNELISHHRIFNQSEETASWKMLWDYRKLNEDEFNVSLVDVKTKFMGLQYKNVGVIMHSVSLLIFFLKNGLLHGILIEDIKSKLKEYLELFSDEKILQEKSFFKYNTTGLGYINESDNDFIEIRKYFYNELERQTQLIKVEKQQNEFYSLLEHIKNDNWDDAYSLYDKYRFIEILKPGNVEDIINILGMDFNSLYNFCYFLDERYSMNQCMSGICAAEYLKSENEFIKGFITLLSYEFEKRELSLFDKFRLGEILKMLELKKDRLEEYK